MNRSEFKQAMSDLIDSVIDSDRELTQDDEDALADNIGESATDILNEADDEAEQPA